MPSSYSVCFTNSFIFLSQGTVVFPVSQKDFFIIKVTHLQKLRAGLSCTPILAMDQFVKLSSVLMTVPVLTVCSQERKWLFLDLKKCSLRACFCLWAWICVSIYMTGEINPSWKCEGANMKKQELWNSEKFRPWVSDSGSNTVLFKQEVYIIEISDYLGPPSLSCWPYLSIKIIMSFLFVSY